MDRIEQIRNRQTARLLKHLEATGQLTDELRSDLLRSMGYIFEDVQDAIKTKTGDGKDEHGTAH